MEERYRGINQIQRRVPLGRCKYYLESGVLFANVKQQEDGNAASRFKRAVEELQQFERTEKTPFDIPDDLQNKVEMRVERYETGIASKPVKLFTSVRAPLIIVKSVMLG